MLNNRIVITVAVGAAVILCGVFVWYGMGRFFSPNQKQSFSTLPVATVTIGSSTVQAEIVKTAEEQSRGLSFREGLADGKGMLFPFPRPVRPGFWMKGMRFSIDIIWIRDDRVVGISADLPVPQVGQSLPGYYPDGLVTAALEVPAGWCTRNNIAHGDAVRIIVP